MCMPHWDERVYLGGRTGDGILTGPTRAAHGSQCLVVVRCKTRLELGTDKCGACTGEGWQYVRVYKGEVEVVYLRLDALSYEQGFSVPGCK